ncbi:uncharacterized protein K02A2.6-like [Rhipicephalus sanguineus]|uniref:uncharacterized protein K02A2.6-like n=1 Tax=Rhipicephalus sanguineus TaxID=34632 RepID=UPI0020C48D97|nr:uncharacterized protein K02A2.6-like [Rhipicephalus sanguineus]
MEAARKNVAETRVVESMTTQLHQMEGEGNYAPADLYEAQAIAGRQLQACYRCGSQSHTHSLCPYVKETCYKCGKKGHIQRACRSNRQSFGGHQQKRSVKTLKVVTQVPPMGVSEQVSSCRTPIFVVLKINGALVEMELDTGAAVSIMPYKQFKQQVPSANCEPTDIVLRTYTGALVQPCGLAVVSVQHGEQTAKLPLYLVDQAGPPLLGREWLHTVRLDWNQIWGLNHVSRSVFDLSSRMKERLETLLAKYKMLFKDELGAITDERAELFFKAGHRPRFLKARNVPFALQSAVEAEIEKLVQLGILTPVSTSEYATPAVPVIKKDGSIRLCGDYKTTINPSLDITHYPLPKIDDLLAPLAGGMHFTKIDLNRAYQQVLMAEESKKYLTLNTQKGLFVVNRLPFGIASAPGIFQKIMDTMLKGLNGVCCYLDDILVTGKNAEEHMINLEALLRRLLERGVRIKKEKCAFFQNELCYLGHKISAAGISASPEKIEAVINAAAPTNMQQLQSFLGVVNYYGKFVPNLSTVAAPFYQLLRKDAPWCWDECCREAFKEVKRTLSSPQVLAHYDPDRPLKLACDASQYGVGAVLSHEFKQFVREMGCRHVQTAPYNPSANGLAERFVQTLKNALKKDAARQLMKVKLNKLLLAYRNTPHATTHEAPANLLLGRRLRTRLDMLKPAVGERVAYEQFKQTVNRRCRVREVSVGDHVLARNYRGQPKWMPAVVTAQSGPVSFRVRASTPSGCFEWRRHKNQLLQGTAGLVENAAQDDGFSVWPQSDTEPEPAPSLPAASVSPSPTTSVTDTSRGDQDRRYPLRNHRPPDSF